MTLPVAISPGLVRAMATAVPVAILVAWFVVVGLVGIAPWGGLRSYVRQQQRSATLLCGQLLGHGAYR